MDNDCDNDVSVLMFAHGGDVVMSHTTWQDNIVADNTGYGTGVSQSGGTVEYNDSYGLSNNFNCSACTTSSTNVEQDPRFTDSARHPTFRSPPPDIEARGAPHREGFGSWLRPIARRSRRGCRWTLAGA